MIPVPSIRTPRLYLRPLQRKDEKDIFDYAKRDDIGPNAGWAPHETITDTRRFIESALSKRDHQPGPFAVIHRKDDRVIGTVEIHSFKGKHRAEVGMVCHPDYQRHGYMYEATMAVMVYAFEHLSLSRLGYSHFPDNKGSLKLREKLLFTYEGTLRNYFMRYDGKLFDFVVASFTDSDYHAHYREVFIPFKKTIEIIF